MASLSIKSLALKWFYFSWLGGTLLYSEFSHLTFKQLGFTSQQIGVTTLMGAQHIFIPPFLYYADKFRGRKALALAGVIGIMFTCALSFSPLIISLPTCFATSKLSSNHSNELMFIPIPRQITNSSVHSMNAFNKTSRLFQRLSEEFSTTTQRVPWLSKLFILMVVSRSLTIMFERMLLCLGNLAVATHLKEQRSDLGAYFMWSHIGGAVSIFFVAFLSTTTKINICGIEYYGYSLMYIVAGCMALSSMVSLPWFKFEYDWTETSTKTINLTELKSTLLNFHYVFMFFLLFYCGLCCSFQMYWEFWYLDGLSVNPLFLGGAALIRRPLLALSAFTSGYLLRNFGEMKTLCVVLLFFTLSFCALSFTRIPWFVLGIDIFQAAGYGLSYCALTVHFSKAGSKQCSGVILGEYALWRLKSLSFST